MAALTQDKLPKTRGTPYKERIAIGTAGRIYKGGLVNRSTTSGRAVAASAAASREIAGLAVSFEGATATGLGVTAATEYVNVEYGHKVLVNLATALRTNAALGLNVFISDDQTMSGTGVGTAGVRVHAGTLAEFEASDKSTGWVLLRQFSHTDVVL